ncbi:hypothetical protein LDENG_00255560 [Lucifuga dentata]|nr:hypothetical protein LDENG_00255560 [Lucifuga dentata]
MAFQLEADLPPALTCLKNVEALLRCPICFDFLSISMMTNCSHNFCSLCIRKFLSYKLQCPVCNLQVTEQDLRNNRTLDDLVVNFKAARDQLSKANYESLPISPKTPASAVKRKTPRDRAQKCNSSVLSHFFQKRPKTSLAKETQRDGSVAQSAQQEIIETARAHIANSGDLHSLHSPTAKPPLAVKEESMDEQEDCIQGLMAVKQENTSSHSSSPPTQQCKTEPSSTTDVKPVIKVECPVCSVSVSQNFINKHLDTCLTRGEKKDSLRSSQGSNRKPMGKLVYNLLSLQELKRKLKECHLSVQGSRDQLVRRHHEFVHIYNSQCDSLNPKTAEVIAKEVEANEKIRNQLQAKTKPVMVFSKNQSEEEIDMMHSNYRKQYNNDFTRLIAQVRGRLETNRHTYIKQEVIEEAEETHKTQSKDQVTQSKSSLSLQLEESEDNEEPSAEGISVSASPTYSDVSISR